MKNMIVNTTVESESCIICTLKNTEYFHYLP